MWNRRFLKLLLPLLFCAATTWPTIEAYKGRTMWLKAQAEALAQRQAGYVYWDIRTDCYEEPSFQGQVYAALSLPAIVMLSPFYSGNVGCQWTNEFTHFQLLGAVILMCSLWWIVAWLWERNQEPQKGPAGIRKILRVVLRISFGALFVVVVAGLLLKLAGQYIGFPDVGRTFSIFPFFLTVLTWTAAGFWLMRKPREGKSGVPAAQS